MKRDRTVAPGSTIEDGGAMLVSPSRVSETGSGTGEPFPVRVEVICVESLRHHDNLRVERAPAIVEQPTVRHFVGQGVFERVLELRKKAHFIEKLRRLQPGE